mgnify:CR=1 FL=1
MSHHNEDPCQHCGVDDKEFRRLPVTFTTPGSGINFPLLLCWVCIARAIDYRHGGVRAVAIAIEGDRPILPPNKPLYAKGGTERRSRNDLCQKQRPPTPRTGSAAGAFEIS